MPVIAYCGERWFRKDGDGVNWVLMLDASRFEIDFYRMDGKRTKAEGSTEETAIAITFKDRSAPDGPSIVHSNRYLKKKVGDELYLVQEIDQKEFNEALGEKDPFLRSMFLGSYFHLVPVKPFSSERRANPATAHAAGDKSGFPIVSFADAELKPYGEKSPGCIEVRITGPGVAKPGRYYLKDKTTAFDAVQKAGITEPKFSINRSRESAEKVEQFRFVFDTGTADGAKKAKEFTLEADDVILVSQPII